MSLIGHAPGATGAAIELMLLEAVLAKDCKLNSLPYYVFAGRSEVGHAMASSPVGAQGGSLLAPMGLVTPDTLMLNHVGCNILCHNIALQLQTAKNNVAVPSDARLKKWTKAIVSPTLSVFRIDSLLPSTTYTYDDLLSGA